MKAAIYTRYSTDKQRNSSTEDQERNCCGFAAREGLEVVSTFSDEEISGTIRQRPQYGLMLEAAQRRDFDVLLIDDLSRLARDAQEQGLTLRRLKFLDIRVVGVSEGYDSDAPGEKIHATVKGLVNELYVDNIRFQTKRGLEGRVLKGLSAGGKAYGYATQPVVEDGQVVGYEMKLVAEQAEVVRQIFSLYADGNSPLAIAKKLNDEGICSPRGHSWARSAIHGDPRDGSGILNNSLYNGIYVWNRARFVTNPETGKRTRKPNDKSAWVTCEVPHLRIVSEEIWDRVKARQQEVSRRSLAKQAECGPKARTGAGPKYLFSGLLKCALCGSNFSMVDGYRYGCARHKDRGETACSNNAKVSRRVVEAVLLKALKERLLSVDALKHYGRALESSVEQQLKGHSVKGELVAKEVGDVERQIRRLVESIKAGIDPSLVRDEINRLQKRRDVLAREHAESCESAPVASEIIARGIAHYDELIANLEGVLSGDVAAARTLLRELFGGEITLIPGDDGTLDAKMASSSAGLFSLISKTPGVFTESQINVVAGTGFEPVTFGL
ncbi:recombinase family protein [Castellaniella sp. MT123]|uniref:recombinase family protein n=1 Tax=Castellaniella sp. MT123 TaxID=3140381 RepID=UPI0031F3FD58